MAPRPKQRRALNSLDDLEALRTQVIQMYESRNKGKKFIISTDKDSPHYKWLQDDIKKVVGNTLSPSALEDFFNNDLKLSFYVSTLDIFEKYIASIQPSPDTFGFSQQRQALHDSIENKLLKHYQQKAALVIASLDNFETIHEPLTIADIEILEQLRPLYECLSDIHWTDIKNRTKKNANIIQGLKIKTPFENIIVGFYILYPLTRYCKERIDSGEIRKSDEFAITDIAPDFNTAKGLYISIVYGIDFYSRAIIIMKIMEELQQIIRTYPDISRFYTRPVSEDGLRNALKHNFIKMQNSGLYAFDIAR